MSGKTPKSVRAAQSGLDEFLKEGGREGGRGGGGAWAEKVVGLAGLGGGVNIIKMCRVSKNS